MKLTQQQIDEAVAKGDYTGGYKFLPWLIYMDNNWIRFGAGLLLLALGVFLKTDYALEKSFDPQFQIIASAAIAAAGVFLMFWTIRMYKRMKKGISD